MLFQFCVITSFCEHKDDCDGSAIRLKFLKVNWIIQLEFQAWQRVDLDRRSLKSF